MLSKILHQFWEGHMSPDVIRWTATVINMNPGFEYKLWNLDTISELGITGKNALSDYGSWANLSNVVRVLAVAQFGGIWLDSDFECVKPLDPLLEHSAFTAVQDFESMDGFVGKWGRINGSVFGCEAHHPWIEWQVDNIQKYWSASPLWIVWLQSLAPRDGLTILPTEYFFPFPHDAPPDKRVVHQDSYLVHHWLGSWT